MTTAMIATKTNSPAIAGMKYWSAIETTGVGDGVAVAAGSCTLNAVVADAGQ